jgi:hypothetical protein
MKRSIDFNDDLIDVESITDRYDYLEDSEDTDDIEERELLENVLNELECGGGDYQWNGNWYPSHIVNEDYFETYMDDMLEDIGDIPRDLPSYLTIIVDYDMLKMDYTTIEIDGNTFLYR